jgi:phage tail-like protein
MTSRADDVIIGGLTLPELFLNGKRMMIRKGHRLLVLWDGKEIPGVVKVLQSGNIPGPLLPSRRKHPCPERTVAGRTKGFQVVIKRGMGDDKAFREWFTSAREHANNGGKVRKDVDIRIVDEKGAVLISYSLISCLPTDLIIQPGLGPGGGALGMEELVLETKGLVIDE